MYVLKNLYNFFGGRQKILDAFESKMFLIKSKGAGILNPNYFITKKNALKITNSPCTSKSSNNTESLLYETRQIVYSLYQSKKITKKVSVT